VGEVFGFGFRTRVVLVWVVGGEGVAFEVCEEAD
jgi:hypothetical protein